MSRTHDIVAGLVRATLIDAEKKKSGDGMDVGATRKPSKTKGSIEKPSSSSGSGSVFNKVFKTSKPED